MTLKMEIFPHKTTVKLPDEIHIQAFTAPITLFTSLLRVNKKIIRKRFQELMNSKTPGRTVSTKHHSVVLNQTYAHGSKRVSEV